MVLSRLLRFHNFNTSSCIELLVKASKAPKGSSSNKTPGFIAKALAIATRCFIPPDNCPGNLSLCESKLTIFRL